MTNTQRSVVWISFCAVAVFLVILLVRGVATSPEMAQTVNPYGQRGFWDLIFNDDFNTQTLDPNRWTSIPAQINGSELVPGAAEQQWYQAENIVIQDGVLRLEAVPAAMNPSDGKTYPYSSEAITTGFDPSAPVGLPRFAYKYGYAEIRARVPQGSDLFPIIGLLPMDRASKSAIEVVNTHSQQPGTVQMSVHYASADGSPKKTVGLWTPRTQLSTDWHTYAVDWKPDSITWYMDGIQRFQVTDKAQIPSVPMYLILALASGGAPGPSTASPAAIMGDLEIDYARVWKRGAEVVLNPTAAAYVDATQPGKNFGATTDLEIDGLPKQIAYLKYDLRGLSGKQIQSAWLRVKTTSHPSAGSVNTQTVHLVPQGNWEEQSLTYQNRPPPIPDTLGILAGTQPDVHYDIPLDTTTIQGQLGGMVSLAFQTDNYDGLYIFSRGTPLTEPRLFITYK